MLSPNADDDASGRGPVRWRRRPTALLLAWITFLLQNRQTVSLEPVRLQPLHFLRSVAAGDNVQTMCAVQSGDEVDFSWRKDGQPLSASGHRLVIHSLPTTSILLIKNATVFDAGNYTCVGRNALGQDSVTAQLRVEDAVEVPPGPRWQGASESSIELSSVSRQDVGTYRCRADNGLGQVSADIELVVRAPQRAVEPSMDARQRLRRYDPMGPASILSWDQCTRQDLASRSFDDHGLSRRPRTTSSGLRSTGYAGRNIVLVCDEHSWNRHVLHDPSRGLPANRKLFLAGAVKKEVKGTTLGFRRRPTALRISLALRSKSAWPPARPLLENQKQRLQGCTKQTR
ncbi:hypothetical protein MTO96_036196 [Rhipicephalus appendiculatus]